VDIIVGSQTSVLYIHPYTHFTMRDRIVVFVVKWSDDLVYIKTFYLVCGNWITVKFQSRKGNAVTDLIKMHIQNYSMKGSPKCIRTKSQIYRYLHYFHSWFFDCSQS